MRRFQAPWVASSFSLSRRWQLWHLPRPFRRSPMPTFSTSHCEFWHISHHPVVTTCLLSEPSCAVYVAVLSSSQK